MDRLTKSRRSWNMGRVGSKNTKPELIVRSLLHCQGYRFRLHRKDLPGKPDIVLPKYNTVIFVHGCFWHRHANCADASTPKTRTDFWLKKFSENTARDAKNQTALINAGWKVIIVWECETMKLDKLASRLNKSLKVKKY
ncbi:MAG: DNA mismatch endonuclease Vsr [Sideroxyarcus sp.]